MRTTILSLVFAVSCLGQSWSGILNSTRAVDWQRANVGVSGGIPTTYTLCNTIAAYSGTATTINNAIAACGANTYLQLGAGTFTLSSSIQIVAQNNVILRGNGPTSTSLTFTGAGVGGIFSASIWVAPSPALNVDSAAVQPGGANACTWTAGYTQGATSITLTNCGATGILNNDMIALDQRNDLTDTGGYFSCELTTSPASIPCSATGQNPNNTGRFISGVSWAQMQHVRVTAGCASACNGAGPYTLTISPGLYANNWGHGGAGTTGAYFFKGINHVGIENLTIDNTNCPNDASCQSAITIFDCDQCWRKNVRSINTRRNHTWMLNSTRVEIRDSYMFGVKNAASQSYGTETAPCDDCLIENNICQQVSTCLMAAGNPGSVESFNYTNNHPVGVGFTFMQADYTSHSGDDYMALFEGNQTNGLWSDQLHGTSNIQTVFRNWLSGTGTNIYCVSCTPTNQTFPFDLDSYNRGYNIIGNVLGTVGYHTSYEAYPPNTYTQAQCNVKIYGGLGFAGGLCGNLGAAGVPDDTLVRSTLMRWGNYDVFHAAVQWDATESSPGAVTYISANTTPATHTLPNSMYLSAKPGFFNVNSGTVAPWPPIGPDVTGGTGPGGMAYLIPAANCYLNIMSGPPDGSGSVLSFDANLCYAGTPSGGGGSTNTGKVTISGKVTVTP